MFGHVADVSLFEKGEITVLFTGVCDDRGLAAEQRPPVHPLGDKHGKIERVCAGQCSLRMGTYMAITDAKSLCDALRREAPGKEPR